MGREIPLREIACALIHTPENRKTAEHKAQRFFLYQATMGSDSAQLSLDWLTLMPGPMVDAITQDLIY